MITLQMNNEMTIMKIKEKKNVPLIPHNLIQSLLQYYN